jgi:hypothetical protein
MSQNNTHLLTEMEEMLKWKKSKKYYAEKLSITENEVEDLIKIIRSESYLSLHAEIDRFTEGTKKVNLDKGTMESVVESKFEPQNDIQLAKLHKIDLTKYVIRQYYSKLKSNGNFTSTVIAVLKKAEDYNYKDFEKFVSNFKATTPKEFVAAHNAQKPFIDAELSLSDYHLAKRHIDGDNSIEARVNRFYDIAENLVFKTCASHNIDTVVFPISNDFFHTDNYQNQTTQGTPQDTIMSYDEEYELGFKVLVKTINMLRANSNNVHVVLVQGNHDRTKSFYLAHALATYFRDARDITFDREHSVIKGMTLGNTFIGWHHGNCKIADLPLLFATSPKFAKEFGNAEYREVHTGDKHHYMAIDIKGVRIQQMPSLSGVDRWHADNNYVNSVRAGIILLYDRSLGKIGEFESRLK